MSVVIPWLAYSFDWFTPAPEPAHLLNHEYRLNGYKIQDCPHVHFHPNSLHFYPQTNDDLMEIPPVEESAKEPSVPRPPITGTMCIKQTLETKENKMRKLLAVGMFLCLSLSPGPLWAAGKSGVVDFTIFLRDDRVFRLDSRKKLLNIERSAFNIIAYEKVGDSFRQVSKLEWPEITRDIYSIDLINSNRTTYSKAKILLTRQDHSQTEIQYGSLYYYNKDDTLVDTFYCSEYNEIASRWTETRIPIERVKKLVLGTTRLMINSKTGTLFPPDYRYDPRTGEPLVETALKED